jgi:hypothetical protein
VLVQPGQHGMSIRCRKQARSNVERLTAVLMVARTCSRVRTHGRGRRCGVGSQAHAAPSASLPLESMIVQFYQSRYSFPSPQEYE